VSFPTIHLKKRPREKETKERRLRAVRRSAKKIRVSEQKIKFQNVQKQTRLHFCASCMCRLKMCCHSNAARGYICNRVFRNKFLSIPVLLSIIERPFFGLQIRNKFESLSVLLSIIDRLFFGLQFDKVKKNAPKTMKISIEKMGNREIGAD